MFDDKNDKPVTRTEMLAWAWAFESTRKERESDEYDELDHIWPFKYRHTFMYRVWASVFLILWTNEVLTTQFGVSRDFIHMGWCLVIPFVPGLGSVWTIPLMIIAVMLGYG